MIRTNSTISDPRVHKEANSLSNHERFSVTVLAWDREATCERFGRIGGARIDRLRLKAPYSNALLVVYLPIFWLWVLLKLSALHPDIVHSFDIDAFPPSYLYRKLSGKSKIILDVCDRFSDSSLFSSPIIRSFRELLAFLEDAFACKADSLIVASERQLNAFKRAGSRKADIVMNCPRENSLKNRLEDRKSRSFRVVHAGTIRGDYGVIELVEALGNVKDVKLIFAGRIRNPRIPIYISGFHNVEFLGELPYEKALEVEASADVIPILCDPKRPATPQALPNRLFEAMMLGVPVIVNNALKSSVEIVSATGCGLVVKYDPISIKKAILYLKENSEARIEMSSRGRKAFAEKYNWSKMEERLLSVYGRLTSKDSN